MSKRIIKYRGLSLEKPIHPQLIDKGEWVFGSLFHDTRDDTFHIWDEAVMYWVRVDPATVGQFTGLTDKNGKEIYEGDIIEDQGGNNGKIYFHVGSFYIDFGNGFDPFIFDDLEPDYTNDGDVLREFPIIGNTHDNPELLNQ